MKINVYAAAPAIGCGAVTCRSRNTYFALDELPNGNWAIAGELLDEE